jgi:ligand-binding sensor protein
VGWVLHRHGSLSFSVIVHVIDIEGVRVGKSENYAPVCANRYRPNASHAPFKGVQP